MLGDERLDVCNELACQAQREIGVDPILDHRDAQLLERRDLPLGERLVGEVGQSGAAPQIQRFSQLRRALGGPVRSSLLDKPTEPVRVDARRLDREDVARWHGAQDGGKLAWTPARFQALPEIEDETLECRSSRRRSDLAP
jgi:hypothetical protein